MKKLIIMTALMLPLSAQAKYAIVTPKKVEPVTYTAQDMADRQLKASYDLVIKNQNRFTVYQLQILYKQAIEDYLKAKK